MTPEEFWKALADMPEPQQVFYRLYHDSAGVPLFYSMEDLPGTYIELDQATYAKGASNVRVRDGKLVELTWNTSSKIVPSTHGTQCHEKDVAIVVKENGTYWSKQTYETS